MGQAGGRTGNLLRGIPGDHSRDLVFFTERAVFDSFGIALSLSLLVLGVTLDTTFLAGSLHALQAGHVTDGLLDLAHGALHSAGSLTAQLVRCGP